MSAGWRLNAVAASGSSSLRLPLTALLVLLGPRQITQSQLAWRTLFDEAELLDGVVLFLQGLNVVVNARLGRVRDLKSVNDLPLAVL